MTNKKSTAKKSSAKKITTKISLTKKISTNNTLPFNKKNVFALADAIYSEKDGVVSFLKLCEDSLSDNKEGKRTMHCGIGEMYYTFVNKNMRRVNDADPDYVYDGISCQGPTALAVGELVEAAVLKKVKDKNSLISNLEDIIQANDNVIDFDLNDIKFLIRSKKVADIIRKRVAPLLK